MGIDKVIEDPQKVLDFKALCPQCKGYTVHIHDLRCQVCDNKFIVWCPSCEEHFKVTF